MRRTALIVEDDPDLQKAMTERLAAMDFDVRGALHYEGAVHELRAAGEPTLVCVDLELPTQSGYELCEHIRGALGLDRVPILVTSDSGFPEDMACAEQAGANAFLKKPFSMQDFDRSIAALLDRSRMSDPGDRGVQP